MGGSLRAGHKLSFTRNSLPDIDQLNKILHLVGTPDEEFLSKVSSQSARQYVQQLPRQPKKDFSQYFRGANPLAVDLLEKLLTLDPDRRPSAEEALGHPYLAQYHDPGDEVCMCACVYYLQYKIHVHIM